MSAPCLSAVRRVRHVVRVVLPQRMALPVVAEQDTSEIRMTVEHHAEQVVAFALHPVRPAIDAGETGTVDLSWLEPAPHHHSEARIEVLHAAEDFQPLLLPVDAREPVE